MPLSERTIKKMRAETEESGGKIYEDKEDALDEDVTTFDEDSDPLTLAGDPVGDEDDNSPVGQVPDEEVNN